MKNLLLPLFCLFLNFMIAQPFIPMLEEDHLWSIDVHECPFKIGQWGIRTVDVNVSGETSINGKVYKSVFVDRYETCLVREENGKLYKYVQNLNDEEIFIDFTLNLNDTFYAPYEGLDYCGHGGSNNFFYEFLVINETIQFLAGENRKVLELQDVMLPSGLGRMKWIEGIGTDKGFDSYGETLDITCDTFLVCFTENGITYFFNNATSCDNTTLGLPDNLQNEIVLYPNPVSNSSILQLPIALGIDSVRIYDAQGRIVSEEQPSKNYIGINAMHFRSGLYFYEVSSENKVLKIERFIVE